MRLRASAPYKKYVKGFFMNKFFAFFAVFILAAQGASAINFSVGGEKIALIADLPNNDYYMTENMTVDIGIIYEQFKLIVVPVINYNKRWCLFSGSRYWELDKTTIDAIAAEAGVILPAGMTLPFWDAWGGKLLLLAIFGAGVLLVLHEKNKDEKNINCPGCGAAIKLKWPTEHGKIKCAKCGKEYDPPLILDIQEYKIPLFPGKKLYPRHTVLNSTDGKPVMAEVVMSSKHPALFALKNKTGGLWYVKNTDGSLFTVPAEDEAPIKQGLSIDFTGGVQGKIIGPGTDALCLYVKGKKIPLAAGQKLYACDTTAGSGSRTVSGEVISKKTDPGKLGIRNLSDQTWIFAVPGAGKKIAYKKGQVFEINSDVQGETIVDFQGITGKIAKG
jgi:DNA-directed RNA polymerase subunit RPC12/RpoP